MNKFVKLILMDLAIAVLAIVGYSPGLMNLRLSDPSILKAGMSILLGVGLFGGGAVGNYYLLLPEKKIEALPNKEDKLAKAIPILEEYATDVYVGRIADTALVQIERIKKATLRAEQEVVSKFSDTSLSYDKYHGAVVEAGNMALENILSLVNRIQLYDKDEYKRLENYKKDNIPDDIQEKQIALMERNHELATKAIAANEKLILSLDTLAVELTDVNFAENNEDAFLKDIEKLTDEIKYYI